MKALRIKLRQSQASYARAETVTNRTTYPLPPFSTVIGAIHNACGYTEYHPMDISIQGKYETMNREIYVNHGLLNRREDDRNVLVYLQNPDLLSAGAIIVGEGLKGQGNSFRKYLTVRIDNKVLYDKYLGLYDLKDAFDKENIEVIKPKLTELKDKIKNIKTELKLLNKASEEYKSLNEAKESAEAEHESLKEEFDNRLKNQFSIPMSHFRTLVKGPSYQEVLYDVELMIHISAEGDVIEEIKDNINNITSIGRSEDFVEILEVKDVDLRIPEDSYRLKDGYKLYVNIDKVKNGLEQKPYYSVSGDNKKEAKGTVYYLDKNYIIENNKRVFNKIPCLYSSYIGTDDFDEYTVDEDGYIVNFN